MSTLPLTNSTLNALRGVGDPEVERAGITAAELEEFLGRVHDEGLHGVASRLLDEVKNMRPVVEATTVTQHPDMLREAQGLFARYGPEISGALLLAALPQSYATELGARTLVQSAGLQGDLVRRIRHTALFLMFVMQAPAQPTSGDADASILQLWTPDGTGDRRQARPWQICAALRLFHHAIRCRVRDAAPVEPNRDGAATGPAIPVGVPLNQEDLLGMLLTFTVSVFEVLERYGICWTSDEQTAYLHVWDVIGDHLGIGGPTVKDGLAGLAAVTPGWQGLRPPSVDDTRALLDQIRGRHWIDPGLTSAPDNGPASGQRAGRLLTSALLDELSAAMPPALKLMPITVIRTLAPDVVRKRLSLGHNGVVIRALGQLPKRRNVIGRFTAISTPNPIFGRVLRYMANEVTGRASVHFLKESDYFFPGLEQWSGGFPGDH